MTSTEVKLTPKMTFEISYYSKRLEIRPQAPNNCYWQQNVKPYEQSWKLSNLNFEVDDAPR